MQINVLLRRYCSMSNTFYNMCMGLLMYCVAQIKLTDTVVMRQTL